MKFVFAIVTIALTFMLCGCPDDQPTADEQQHAQQEQLSAQSNMAVGMPAITNFGPKKTLKVVLELADKMKPTYSYVKDMNGPFRKICDSIGYPIPYSTQFTNPQYIAYEERQVGVGILPQADPTGLFSPAQADASWVLCLDPVTHQLAPFYEEEKVTTSPFPLKGAIE